jgi:hypothetical protein
VANEAELRLLARVREICTALPGITERLSHGEVTWFIGEKRVLATMDDHHHGAEHFAVTCPAPPGVQQDMVGADPDRFYRPPYVGPAGWIGIRLDDEVDWDEVERIIEDAFRLRAPKTLVRQLDVTRG